MRSAAGTGTGAPPATPAIWSSGWSRMLPLASANTILGWALVRMWIPRGARRTAHAAAQSAPSGARLYSSAMTTTQIEPAQLVSYAAESEPWFRASLRTLVEHPTVSPGGGQEAEIRRGAEAARDLVRSLDGEADLIETGGTPAVFGGFPNPGARTQVVVYNHLDVQPADLDTWTKG